MQEILEGIGQFTLHVFEQVGVIAILFGQTLRQLPKIQRRLTIARALVQEPRLLIFDEPTGNLDIANEELIIDEAKKAARQRGVAILSSLHDLNQALCLGDKFFLLRDGAVRYAGDESVLTSEVIGDIFDIQSRIITVDGKKVILGGKYYEES